jgi:hypothetical protein
MISSPKTDTETKKTYEEALQNEIISDGPITENHNYFPTFKNQEFTSTSNKAKRLQNELILLQKNLPCSKSNAIFIKYEYKLEY